MKLLLRNREVLSHDSSPFLLKRESVKLSLFLYYNGVP